MNQSTTLPPFATGAASPLASATHAAAIDTLQSRFALRVAARLSEGADSIGPEIAERLRFAREQALQRARAARAADAVAAGGGRRFGALTLGRAGGSGPAGWWLKLASVLPVLSLVGGLFLIDRWQDNSQISVAAEIDAALLSDDLPPTAYSDAGFAEFLKTPSE